MTLLSKLRPFLSSLKSTTTVNQRAMSEHRVFPLQPSRWFWKKFKDLVHMYVIIGLVPGCLFVGYQNMFTGPATLSEIPEGYIPKYWEYYRNPVTRFIARYLTTDPQQDYEKWCAFLFVESEQIKLRELENKIKDLLAERNDYQAYYYKPVTLKGYRMVRESADVVLNIDSPVKED